MLAALRCRDATSCARETPSGLLRLDGTTTRLSGDALLLRMGFLNPRTSAQEQSLSSRINVYFALAAHEAEHESWLTTLRKAPALPATWSQSCSEASGLVVLGLATCLYWLVG